MRMIENYKAKVDNYKSLDAKDKKLFWKEAAINNALYVLLLIAIIYTFMQNSRFLAPASIVILSAFPRRTFLSPAVLQDVLY